MEEGEKMNTYDFVHLLLLAAGGQLNGRTKLQKTVYFAGALTGQLSKLGYRAHYYGPYSSDVAAAVDELRSLGFLKQVVNASGAVNSQGFEIARYDYELTEAGQMVAKDKAEQFPHEWGQIQDAMKQMRAARDEDYVKLSIAAKAFFLRSRNPKTTSAEALSPEALSKQTSRFGWQVTPEEFRAADEILKSMNLSHTYSPDE